MKRWLLPFLTLLALTAIPTARANDSAAGWCENGAQVVITSGLRSTTTVQASYPTCTISVSIHSGGLATIYSDNAGTVLSNPFTAQLNGQWQFFATQGRYDITMTGGGLSGPVTYSDVIFFDPVQFGETQCALTFSTTPNYTANVCSLFSMTLSSNVTGGMVTSPIPGQAITISLCQDATGGRAVTWPANFYDPPTMTPTAGACSQFTFVLLLDAKWHHVATGESTVFNTAAYGNILQINGNGITDYTGSGAVIALQTSPTLNTPLLNSPTISGTIPGNATFTGNLNLTGNLTMTAGQNSLTAYNLNNVCVVDGNKYVGVAGINSCNALYSSSVYGLTYIPSNTPATTLYTTPTPNGVLLVDTRLGNDPGIAEGGSPASHSHILDTFHAGTNSSWESVSQSGTYGLSVQGYADAGGNGANPSQAFVVPLFALAERTGGARPIEAANFNMGFNNLNNQAVTLELDVNNVNGPDDTTEISKGLQVICGVAYKCGSAIFVNSSNSATDAFEEDAVLTSYAKAAIRAQEVFAPPAGFVADINAISFATDTSYFEFMQNPTRAVWTVDHSGNIAAYGSASFDAGTKPFNIFPNGQIGMYGIAPSANESIFFGIDTTHGVSIAPNTNLNNGTFALAIQSASATNIPLRVSGQLSQSVDLLDFTDYLGAVLSKIDKSGNATFPNLAFSQTASHINTNAASNDIDGTIAIAAATSGAYNFAIAYTNAPVCTLTPVGDPTATGVWWVTTSTTSVTAHVASSGTISFAYHCVAAIN